MHEFDPLVKEYLSCGLYLLACFSVIDGRCNCRQPDCTRQGRHCRSLEPKRKASTDITKIRAELQKYPRSNLGAATGKDFGIWAITVDVGSDADKSLADLGNCHGAPLPTPTFESPAHDRYVLLLRHPTHGSIKSRRDLMRGLTVHGEDQVVALPPSIGLDGPMYTDRLSNVLTHFPEAPSWLLELVNAQTNYPKRAEQIKTIRQSVHNLAEAAPPKMRALPVDVLSHSLKHPDFDFRTDLALVGQLIDGGQHAS